MSAEGQEEEEEEEMAQEKEEDSLMLSGCTQSFAYFVLIEIPFPLTPAAQRASFSSGPRPPSSAQLFFSDAAALVNVTFL